MFSFSTDFMWGCGIVAAVVLFVPGAWSWVKKEFASAKVAVESVAAKPVIPVSAATANTVATNVVTSLSTLDPYLSAAVKADLANVIANIVHHI